MGSEEEVWLAEEPIDWLLVNGKKFIPASESQALVRKIKRLERQTIDLTWVLYLALKALNKDSVKRRKGKK